MHWASVVHRVRWLSNSWLSREGMRLAHVVSRAREQSVMRDVLAVRVKIFQWFPPAMMLTGGCEQVGPSLFDQF